MTRQLRNIPAELRNHAVLHAVHAVFQTGTRYVKVTFDHNFRGVQTRRYELVGFGLNAAATSNTEALIVREIDNTGSALLDFIPVTRLISIVADPDGGAA